ncbi:3-phosphoserine/phosphohydroxythreonine transaminase [Paenibacillus sp. MMS18-CY102]|uniref:3-phosphoserine/phosphohydroxythreonine transaminase n=1 Tax=Paenibacillus sp. MMS18-CY102 TaxID=2682849 RepID=UPI0013661CB6|nr:3-phosphoserine/phosphohydroxythreonine transaminase [Paenibacillus sp. MMS18-CY102]MWC26882.1 3-phosphoserine/phosphohydroxythreonine transaminase [Paenibacillus sp. MMS18-CY102]
MRTLTERVHNFNPGPAALPTEVLQQAQAELLNFQSTGMSVMELSHRSNAYEAVHNKAQQLLRELLSIPAHYQIMFLQGGASMQFGMIPLNLLSQGKQAGYIVTGMFAERAYQDAAKVGSVYAAASTKDNNYRSLPRLTDINVLPDSAYVHLTSNNTVFGTQWTAFPDTGSVPLVADMSSDILSKPIDVQQFSLIYAGAQKNLGPSGVTVVIADPGLFDASPAYGLPSMLSYKTHLKNNSLYNTPPTFSIYLLQLMLQWVQDKGGIAAVGRINRDKASAIYDTIDQSNGYYDGHADVDCRSDMNITFRLPSDELAAKFIAEADANGLVGLGGHRSVGGIRASIYNATSLESCLVLRDFMLAFKTSNPS